MVNRRGRHEANWENGVSSMYHEIESCRICGGSTFHTVLDLGTQALTGVFPASTEEHVPAGPLELVKCCEETGGCGLVQLKHSYEPDQMYGENYGYRSGLNASMVKHLQRRVSEAKQIATPQAGDIILDIGANDSTTLRSYGDCGLRLIGMDPTGSKFSKYYPEWVDLIPDFFSAKNFKEKFGEEKAKIVTSISMFYDLEDPTDFMKQVSSILAEDGIWVFEQSYLPLMIERDAYDTVCHEHVSYYALAQIQWMAERAGLKILDVELNDINGGSFCVTAAKQESAYECNQDTVDHLLAEEKRVGYDKLEVYSEFESRVIRHKSELQTTIQKMRAQGRKVIGYGASTKGNVLLQYCDFDATDLAVVAEVNEEKFGKYTPQTHIPIVSEEDAKALSPDVMVVLPWHFKDNIVQREQAFLNSGGKLLFPLPSVHEVGIDREERRAA